MISQALKIRQRRRLGPTSKETTVLLGKKDTHKRKHCDCFQVNRQDLTGIWEFLVQTASCCLMPTDAVLLLSV